MDDSGVDPDAPLLEDSEIAANAILDVDIALSQIESFKDDFVSCISFIIHCVKDVVVVVVLEGCCCISSPSQKKKHFLVLGVPDVVNIPLRSLWAPVSLGGL